MNADRRQRRQLELMAYHDGELHGLRRLLVARRLAQNPEARRELAELRALGGLLREGAGEPQDAGPDLWEAIRAELPTAPSPLRDGARSWAGGEPSGQDRPGSRRAWRRPGALGGAVGAGLAAAALFALLWGGGDPGDAAARSSVRWLDAGGTPTMVLQDDREATIIWLLGPPDAPGTQRLPGRSDRAVG